ncbi:hypothetical protein [Streptomyces sp. SID10815]|uniref:hypothetical protein n=1 Tax=Streptomyces sp. SID10815 TaxID=2706027 RepID=UPI0013C6218F|nr:hypothetical protein [Streptomyces sp. SID10815]NEA52406.1 hypothetical protein [Streptomyces sp. SID10815]
MHAEAYVDGDSGDLVCTTCRRRDCPRYWRIQNRLDAEAAARRALLPAAGYDEEPPW